MKSETPSEILTETPTLQCQAPSGAQVLRQACQVRQCLHCTEAVSGSVGHCWVHCIGYADLSDRLQAAAYHYYYCSVENCNVMPS